MASKTPAIHTCNLHDLFIPPSSKFSVLGLLGVDLLQEVVSLLETVEPGCLCQVRGGRDEVGRVVLGGLVELVLVRGVIGHHLHVAFLDAKDREDTPLILYTNL